MSNLRTLINKYKELPIVVKATLWLTFAMLMQKALMSLSVPIITRFLTLEEYANYSIYQTWFNVFIVLCTFNLSSSIFNTILMKNPNNHDKAATTIMFFEFTITTLVFLVYLLISVVTGPLQGISFFQSMILFLQILVNIPISIWIAKRKYEYKYLLTSIVILVQSVITITLNVLAIIFLNDQTNGLILSTITTYGLFSFSIMMYLLYKNKTLFDLNIWKYALVVGFPLIFHYLAQSVLAQSNKLFIDFYIGKIETAIYSLSTSIAFILQTLIMALHSSYMPWFYKRIASNNNKHVNFSGIILVGLISIFTINISLFGPEIIYVFGGNEYMDGKFLIPPLSSSIIVMLVYNFYSSIEFYYGRTRLVSAATIIAAICHIALSFLLIPKLGYLSSAYITIVSYLIMCLFHYVFSKRVLKQNNNYLKLYNDPLIFTIMFIGILINLLVILTYQSDIIRYAVIGAEILAFFLIVIIKGKDLKKIIHRLLSAGDKNNENNI